MSDKYVARKYVTEASFMKGTIKCPNCYQPMTRTKQNHLVCVNASKCKLFQVLFEEVKSLTTIKRVD
jgi:hypothetical protein